MVIDKPLEVSRQFVPLHQNCLLDSTNRDTAFNIVKDGKLEQSKTHIITKIMGKKSIYIQGCLILSVGLFDNMLNDKK